PIAVTSIQAEDFSLISKYLGGILTTQELDRLKKMHNLYVELEANGALSKMKNSIKAQYGPISMTTLEFERRLEIGWSNRMIKIYALKQKHHVDAIKKEIVTKFQKAFTKEKARLRKEKKEKRKAQAQQSTHQMMKKEITTKQSIDKSRQKMWKVLKELKEESRLKISWKNIEEIAILRFKNKTEKVTSERMCKENSDKETSR
ncbi:10275_t:CDS:2, partial [Cetraspora pellucida]